MLAQNYSSFVIVDEHTDPSFKPNVETVTGYGTGGEVTKEAKIDVAAPNSSGVSLNKFSEFGMGFNQGSKGKLDVNNNDAAKLIVFEVTGPKASLIYANARLNGEKADMLFANPNGYKAIMSFWDFGKFDFTKSGIGLTMDGNVNLDDLVINADPYFYREHGQWNGVVYAE